MFYAVGPVGCRTNGHRPEIEALRRRQFFRRVDFKEAGVVYSRNIIQKFHLVQKFFKYTLQVLLKIDQETRQLYLFICLFVYLFHQSTSTISLKT